MFQELQKINTEESENNRKKVSLSKGNQDVAAFFKGELQCKMNL